MYFHLVKLIKKYMIDIPDRELLREIHDKRELIGTYMKIGMGLK